MSESSKSMTLLQLQQRVNAVISSGVLRDVWVTAELSDVSIRGGHCYMELLQKDDSGVNILAKARAVAWANVHRIIASKFMAATGRALCGGIKVMLCISASYHPVYGFSYQISDIDPAYTMGDLMRLRREILERLSREGILDQNRSLQWPAPAQRIAVISAPGAAGYGDFINQLFGNSSHLRFTVRLFEAVMQGDRAPSTIISALERIAAEADAWDGVVIIRGGGASSDLAAFENYDLAAHIAMFPLPVIVGIGHERDVTVLDYVANLRVKTPTAAAEWLIGQGNAALDRLRELASAIALSASDRISGCMTRLAYIEGQLPVMPFQALERQGARLSRLTGSLAAVAERIAPHMALLDAMAERLTTACAMVLERRAARLDSYSQLLAALSPEATLRRGFSITRIGGRALTDASQAPAGSVVETVLANGSFTSKVQ